MFSTATWAICNLHHWKWKMLWHFLQGTEPANMILHLKDSYFTRIKKKIKFKTTLPDFVGMTRCSKHQGALFQRYISKRRLKLAYKIQTFQTWPGNTFSP